MIASQISRTDNARLAEYLLRQLGALEQVADLQRVLSISDKDKKSEVAATRLREDIRYIHSKKRQEILERMNPNYLSDDEASELLFKMAVDEELEKVIPKKVDVEVSL